MSQITDSYPSHYAQTIADLDDPSRAVLGLSERHPDLPAGLFTVSFIYPRRVEVQLRSFAHVEPWREALGVNPAMIEASAIDTSLYLAFMAPVDGIEFRVYVLGPVGEEVPPLAPKAPTTTACVHCSGRIGWVDCSTGGWWAHEAHPADEHDAEPVETPASVLAAEQVSA